MKKGKNPKRNKNYILNSVTINYNLYQTNATIFPSLLRREGLIVSKKRFEGGGEKEIKNIKNTSPPNLP